VWEPPCWLRGFEVFKRMCLGLLTVSHRLGQVLREACFHMITPQPNMYWYLSSAMFDIAHVTVKYHLG
jgi:hypothetical protein